MTREEIAVEVRKLEWVLGIVISDFDDNDSPCLSISAVNAVESVRSIVTQQDDIPEQADAFAELENRDENNETN